MNTIKIQIPQGFAFDRFDEATGEVKLKPTPKPVMERIKTIDDVLADNGLTKATFDKQCEALTDDEKNYRLLKLVSKSLNEDWTPNWNDEDQYKYYPWFYMGGSSGFRFDGYAYRLSSSPVGSRLCFKTSKLAEYAGKQFEDVYKQFMLIP
jgi:hypothetical protein